MTTPINRHRQRDARLACAKTHLRIIEAGIIYGSTNRNYQPQLGDTIVSDLHNNGLVKEEFTDPWGQNYILIQDAVSNAYEIISSGKDANLGTDDDLLKQVIIPPQ